MEQKRKRKKQNKSLYLLLSLLLSLLISCASIKEVDQPICVEINMSKAFCTYTISNKDFIIDDENLFKGKTWWEMRSTMVLVPPESWAAFKKYIIKNCKKTRKCDGMVEGWHRTMSEIDNKLIDKGVEVETTLP